MNDQTPGTHSKVSVYEGTRPRTGHSCTEGPLCRFYTLHPGEPWGCGHLSCERIINEPCNRCISETLSDDDAAEFCPVHGWQDVVDGGEFSGFTGARCYWWKLGCGCHDQDMSADNLGAVK